MADISAEIAAFQNAVYGEEVRSSMVSAIEKINDVAEDAESTVESFSSGVTQAISNANTAASAANTAASNANSKATAANTAATNANTARTAANNAATAANNAASAATTTNTNITNAESARVTAEQARATAESARQANEQSRQTAETARVNAESARASAESSRASAESQRQSNETTRQGNENVRQTQEGLRVSAENTRVNEFEDMQAAFADMQRQIIPQATTSTMGGVIVGDGLNVENALLSLATTKSGSGTAVASNGAVLESVVVYGQSVQEGTPAPSEPVPIEVVSGLSMPSNIAWRQGGVSNSNGGEGNDANRIHTAMFEIVPGATYTVGVTDSNYNYSVRLFSGNTFTVGNFVYGDSTWKSSNDTYANPNAKYMSIVIRLSSNANLSPSDSESVGAFATTSCIGLVVGDTITSINLQGNVLASLPDGTRDTVTVDGAGHCVLTKNTYTAVFDGDDSWVYQSSGTRFNVAPPVPYNKGNLTAFICNQLVYISNTAAAGVDGIVLSGNGNIFISIDATHPEIDTTAELNTYFASSPLVVIYQRETPLQIDLGYIDMPTIPENATISVSASMTPVIDAAWWERGAEAIARTVKAFSERIKALEEAVAELATA